MSSNDGGESGWETVCQSLAWHLPNKISRAVLIICNLILWLSYNLALSSGTSLLNDCPLSTGKKKIKWGHFSDVAEFVLKLETFASSISVSTTRNSTISFAFLMLWRIKIMHTKKVWETEPFIYEIFAGCQWRVRHRIPQWAAAEWKGESKDLVLTWLCLTCLVTSTELLTRMGLSCLFDQKVENVVSKL